MKISHGKIRLENKVIDLAEFEVRPKITEQDLERYYDSFIEHTPEIRDYFEDTSAFDVAVSDAAGSKRPKLIARERKYPFMWAFRASFISLRKLRLNYFTTPRCLISVPGKKRKQEDADETESDKKFRKGISERVKQSFEKYSGYEGIIEIPNDDTPTQAKSSTFHEAVHYAIARYQSKTGRTFLDDSFNGQGLPLRGYQAESAIEEATVEILADKLLAHDPDAQFEDRWMQYSLNDNFRIRAGTPLAIAGGLLLGSSVFCPYLLPLVFVPGRIRDYLVKKHKESKKEELLHPLEYPQFKI
jgi:hypothetical protein